MKKREKQRVITISQNTHLLPMYETSKHTPMLLIHVTAGQVDKDQAGQGPLLEALQEGEGGSAVPEAHFQCQILQLTAAHRSHGLGKGGSGRRQQLTVVKAQ